MGVATPLSSGTKTEAIDRKWMEHAISLARKAEVQGEVPVGAVIVCEGEAIGEGWNQNISRHDPSAHAEIVALRQAGLQSQNHRLPGCVMYVSLEPCAMCVGAMIHARIEKLLFAAPDPKSGALGGAYCLPAVHPHNHVLEYRGGLMADDAAAILKAFFRARR